LIKLVQPILNALVSLAATPSALENTFDRGQKPEGRVLRREFQIPGVSRRALVPRNRLYLKAYKLSIVERLNVNFGLPPQTARLLQSFSALVTTSA
jgi:hypothetical protein